MGGTARTGGALAAPTDAELRARLEAKLVAARQRDTPGRPVRSEYEGATMARDIVNNVRVSSVLPHLVADHTSLTQDSSIVLANSMGSYHAVLVMKHIPPATQSAPAAAALQLDEARMLVQQRAAAFAATAPEAHDRLAVGIVSNVGGLEWVTAPPSPLKALRLVPPSAAGGSYREGASGGASSGEACAGNEASGQGSGQGSGVGSGALQAARPASTVRKACMLGKAVRWALRWAAAACAVVAVMAASAAGGR